MDTNSPLETTDGFNEEVRETLAEKVDLNTFKSEEAPHNEMKVLSDEGYASPPVPLSEASEEEAQYTLKESNLVDSSLPVNELDEAERKTSDYCIERVGSRDEDYEKEKHEDDLDADTDVKDYVEDGDFNHHHKSFSDEGDNDHYDSIGREYYEKPTTQSSTLNDATNANYDQVSVDLQNERIEANEELDDENLNLNSVRQSQMRGGDYSSEMETLENGRMVWENSSLQSTQETRNASISPERQLSISAERSPHSQLPPKGHTSPKQDMPSPSNFDLKSAPSPQSSRRKHSSSPGKGNLGHKRTSRDHLSPSKRPKSPSERVSKRESHNRIDSPRRRLSRSPRKHDSPRRRGRSVSKSPMRRRGSPGHQRDRQRSRSRSPISRNRKIRSPRGQSPRRRSPPNYRSRQRSSRRPWSPPANRNTGIGRPGKNLFIAGFSYVTTERDLERKFSKFGRVTDVRIVRDKLTGDSRGFGFLSLEKDEHADAAIRAVDQTEWNGRILLVEKSKSSSR
ncbi:peptidyl-prolyl cis-trans isomerase CYP63 [Dendrobium catenatum]|uniref:Glycine-rich RNA-binding protein 3, mitochondrial n=1 Tax=Dendrobium catenatum TaxID=906689 RepID=A0A2I0WR65_9ASPA|nr:peptidyl-prolyl cis-trans isomerase CYP63 [Dendrobium catenatum]PKU78153.1 Glycine-rich RNA-binding protein 3, mitochondrial [Dendrobium catenatum]